MAPEVIACDKNPDATYDYRDLTELAKKLRAVEDMRPPHKVTDYSSSSEESGTTDEEDEDVEQGGAGESTSGPEDTRAPSVLGIS
ncbi:PREDICTED: mitogen-activated protein kinase kinase kinase kinase 4-like [Galeopterus variegatus]|uniref:Mitogen-activated protein kinase kinase kinase kinase 4-like n=1 Tax=Galeopterus variegatus TaxID=482537 RepID=A0ABM0Q0M4_GALVR|nr:PREDICTED: mitogen-activated protein kinase kinase kinase kinase 4-like [Galeopterus variegatus]